MKRRPWYGRPFENSSRILGCAGVQPAVLCSCGLRRLKARTAAHRRYVSRCLRRSESHYGITDERIALEKFHGGTLNELQVAGKKCELDVCGPHHRPSDQQGLKTQRHRLQAVSDTGTDGHRARPCSSFKRGRAGRVFGSRSDSFQKPSVGMQARVFADTGL